MRRQFISLCGALTLLVGLAVTAAVSPALAETGAANPVFPRAVYPRDAVIFGSTYGEWSAAWQQWSNSIPVAVHPLVEPSPGEDPRDCTMGQSGPVFFLGGAYNSSTVVRHCTVPKGKVLYFPILNSGCSSAEASVNLCTSTIPEMRAEVARIIDLSEDYEVTLDGKAITSDAKKNFRVQSTLYTLDIPADNIFNVAYSPPPNIPEGQYFGMDDGIYIMLQPLSPGSHVLHFKGTLPQFDFTLDVTYYLTQE